jgi:hypothetical protein
MLTRRNLLTGLGAVLITAPAIVHAGNIMRVRSFKEYAGKIYFEILYQPNIDGGFLYRWNELWLQPGSCEGAKASSPEFKLDQIDRGQSYSGAP